MAETLKVLAQLAPSAGVLTDLYTAPSGKCAVISRVMAVNRTGTTRQYRLSAALAGAADEVKQYLAYDVNLDGARPVKPASGLTLQPTDKLRARASAADLSFSVFGVERPIAATPEDYRILGQRAPGAASLTDAYTVASGSFAVISRIVVCNRDAAAATYRISAAVAGAADDVKQYIAYDENVAGNDTTPAPGCTGITLEGTDVIRVYASTANLSFGIFGYGPVDTPAGGGAAWTYWGPPLGLYFT